MLFVSNMSGLVSAQGTRATPRPTLGLIMRNHLQKAWALRRHTWQNKRKTHKKREREEIKFRNNRLIKKIKWNKNNQYKFSIEPYHQHKKAKNEMHTSRESRAGRQEILTMPRAHCAFVSLFSGGEIERATEALEEVSKTSTTPKLLLSLLHFDLLASEPLFPALKTAT